MSRVVHVCAEEAEECVEIFPLLVQQAAIFPLLVEAVLCVPCLATSHLNLVLCLFVPAGIDGWERHVACDDVTRGMSHVVTS